MWKRNGLGIPNEINDVPAPLLPGIAAFSADGKRLLAESRDGATKLWTDD